MEELIVTFYKVHRCGYYIGNERKFGDLEDALSQLQRWAKNLNFTESAILSRVDDYGTAGNLRNTYFYELIDTDIDTNPKDFLLILWNELPDVEGKVATISKKKKIGDSTKCEIKELSEDSIPGSASYFWFLPTIGYYATICRKGRTNGNAEMIGYLKTFLATYSSYCVTKQDEDGTTIKLYRENSFSEENPHIIPCFKALRTQNKDEINLIKENCSKIKKIIHKEKVSNDSLIQQNFVEKLLVYIGLKEHYDNKMEQKIKYEVNYTPTKEELDLLINEWENETSKKYSDTGFQFQGETADKIHWLSGNIARMRRFFDIDYYDGEIINSKSLLKALEGERLNFIKELKLK